MLERELKISEQNLKDAQKIAHVGHWEIDVLSNKIHRSDELLNIFRVDKKTKNITNKLFYAVVHPDDLPKIKDIYQISVKTKKDYEVNYRLKFNDNEIKYVYEKVMNEFDSEGKLFRSIGIVQDITEGKKAEERIKKSLKEKEILLKEVHHRVKNNMQIVMSLLNLQANTIEDVRIRKALAESNDRISAMGLIHEVLYQSENLSSIDPEEYISKLIQSTTRAYGSIDKKIEHVLNIEKIELALDETIPLALIINELLTNTYKYAFPDSKKGKITITLKRLKDDIIMLKYFDNGIGIKFKVIPHELDSLGLKLVYDLAEGQLKGEVEHDSSTGNCFVIKFLNKQK
jgi:two-component sensor histidine kinase